MILMNFHEILMNDDDNDDVLVIMKNNVQVNYVEDRKMLMMEVFH